MSHHPAFTVRSYPSFRPARLWRVLVAPEALYFIRMKGLISPGDAGNPEAWSRDQRATGKAILWLGRKALASGLAEVERLDPAEAVRSSKAHFKAGFDEIETLKLDPPSLLGQGTPVAKMTLRLVGEKAAIYQIEDEESLEVARAELPGRLGPKLQGKLAGGP